MYETSESPVFASAGEGGGGAAASEEVALQVEAPSNQLTLSYQREVYVFDSVRPERVQAVLLLLGGQELPSEVAGMTMPHNANHRASNDLLRSSNNPLRLASIMRYREKRKNLNFDKKVQYDVRREVASRMKRHKGQFASSKANSEEVRSPSSSCEPTQSNSQEETVSSSCQNCGRCRDSTPMMRRGPGGPRSLCNACGLMWANKGTLRNLPQLAVSGTQNSPIIPAAQSDANDSDIGSNGCMFSATSNGPESILIGEIDATMNLD